MVAELNRNSIVRRGANQVFCSIDDEVVALSVVRGRYFQVDKIGSVIWDIIEFPISVSDLCNRLTELFDVESSRCELDTLDFLLSMRDAGLVECHESSGS